MKYENFDKSKHAFLFVFFVGQVPKTLALCPVGETGQRLGVQRVDVAGEGSCGGAGTRTGDGGDLGEVQREVEPFPLLVHFAKDEVVAAEGL